MKRVTLFISCLIGFCYFLAFSYFVWFHPKDYLAVKKRSHSMEKKGILKAFYLININQMFPKFDLWMARFTSFCAALGCVIGMVAAVFSPYVE
jgi:amino acid transporter